MISQLLGILAGILALIGAGAFSYFSLEKTIGPRIMQTATEQTEVNPEKKQDKIELIPQKPVQVQVSTPVFKKTTIIPHDSTSSVQSPASISKKSAPVSNSSLATAKVTTEKTIVAPGPLRATTITAPNTSAPSSDLTVYGIITNTNIERAQNGGLPALSENELLDRDAQMKVADMFTKQYFEHVSPLGIGPGDLAKTVGYAYVIVGENLALGDFGSDKGVLIAWMNSPGHRANILNAHYKEIGVAVGKGMYEGRETWLAVQSFGMPISACPAISTTLRIQIDANNTEISRLRAVMDAKKAQLDATPQIDPNYNTYVGEFNAIIPEYNALVENNRVLVATYNTSVQSFNSCINVAGSASAH